MRPCIVPGMDVDVLVRALIDRAGGALPVAKAMGVPSFQGTLHKLAHGGVKSPTRRTAERVASHFHIPIEALYDKRVTATVYAELFGQKGKGVHALGSSAPQTEQTLPSYRLEAAASWPLPRIDKQLLGKLDRAVIHDIETAMITLAGHHGVDIRKRRAA